ncbi:SMC-Scp complex subunit ScpB [Aestuariirhabdus litorea]|uniref:SMC-Scp complex subunit ScpB n=2 Tax=Aestuariirhabdus litorea TaxID=2528527 RepID=A0A3P3VRR0_9GAMM|nr:SMC-Scp complex subunit ScpB [Aestuariirhabdus litorea]RWW98658.1 SMC-Scp complex subunit ScpB [Endozoicomonadaceae bacterium GTF-13]
MSHSEQEINTPYNLKLVLEGALFAAGKPLTVEKMGQLFEEHERPSNEEIRAALQTIEAECEGRSIELKLVASGFRLQVRQNLSTWVNRLWEEKPQRYSRAMLETLALIAYRQPITRGEIEDIRGVSVSSNIVKTLLERDWVRVVGHRDVPGRPSMYATTRQFLDYFNLKNLDELPVLSEIRDLERLSEELDQQALAVAGAPLAPGEAVGDTAAAEGEAVAEVPAKTDISSLFEGGPQSELEEDEALFRELDEMEKSLPSSFKDLLKGGIKSGQEEPCSPGTESLEAGEVASESTLPAAEEAAGNGVEEQSVEKSDRG